MPGSSNLPSSACIILPHVPSPCSKLAECQYSRILAQELRPRRIAVAAVCPGGGRGTSFPAWSGDANGKNLSSSCHRQKTCCVSCNPGLNIIPSLTNACLNACLPSTPWPAGWCNTAMASFRGPRPASEGADTPVWLAFQPGGSLLRITSLRCCWRAAPVVQPCCSLDSLMPILGAIPPHVQIATGSAGPENFGRTAKKSPFEGMRLACRC